jgi:hypothetical protein
MRAALTFWFREVFSLVKRTNNFLSGMLFDKFFFLFGVHNMPLQCTTNITYDHKAPEQIEAEQQTLQAKLVQ